MQGQRQEKGGSGVPLMLGDRCLVSLLAVPGIIYPLLLLSGAFQSFTGSLIAQDVAGCGCFQPAQVFIRTSFRKPWKSRYFHKCLLACYMPMDASPSHTLGGPSFLLANTFVQVLLAFYLGYDDRVSLPFPPQNFPLCLGYIPQPD